MWRLPLAMGRYDAVQTLDAWYTTVLLQIKKGLESDELL